jgi:hypothetical protein
VSGGGFHWNKIDANAMADHTKKVIGPLEQIRRELVSHNQKVGVANHFIEGLGAGVGGDHYLHRRVE